MWHYQVLSDIEDDVNSVQAVADVLPKRGHYNHRFSVRPRQVIVVVTWKGDRIENKNTSNGAGVNRT